jgi:hypothetical protein
MGYNRHMPLALVYAPKEVGGIGLYDLPTEQGLAHLLYAIGSLRCSPETWMPIKALIESYMINAGILRNPLIFTDPIPYLKSPWMDVTRQFLKSINGTITSTDLELIIRHRIRDKAIMVIAEKHTSDTNKLKAINNCRLYLQINTLAEMTNEAGDKILKEGYHGNEDEHGKITLHKYSTSLLKWPKQLRPPKRAWRIWKKMIRSIVTKNSLTLRHPLSRWIEADRPQRIWKHTTPTTINKYNKERVSENPKLEKIIVESPILEVIYYTTTTRETNTICWEIHGENKIITHHCERYNKLKNEGTDRIELLALNSVLDQIDKAHCLFNAVPIPATLKVWINKKINRKKSERNKTQHYNNFKINKRRSRAVTTNCMQNQET